jgi:hypothetical protein
MRISRMLRLERLVLFAGACAMTAFGLVAPTAAHHAFSAQFDIDQPIELTGAVTEMKWSNPHTWIYIDVVEDDGTVVNWALETPRAANILIRNGWRRDDLPVGRVITVRGWRARNGTPTANISVVELEDGRQLFAGARTDDG